MRAFSVSSAIILALALSISGCDNFPGLCKCHKQQVHNKAPVIKKAAPYSGFQPKTKPVSAPSLKQCLLQDNEGIADCIGQAYRRFKNKVRAKIRGLIRQCARKEDKGFIEELFCRAIK